MSGQLAYEAFIAQAVTGDGTLRGVTTKITQPFPAFADLPAAVQTIWNDAATEAVNEIPTAPDGHFYAVLWKHAGGKMNPVFSGQKRTQMLPFAGLGNRYMSAMISAGFAILPPEPVQQPAAAAETEEAESKKKATKKKKKATKKKATKKKKAKE